MDLYPSSKKKDKGLQLDTIQIVSILLGGAFLFTLIYLYMENRKLREKLEETDKNLTSVNTSIHGLANSIKNKFEEIVTKNKTMATELDRINSVLAQNNTYRDLPPRPRDLRDLPEFQVQKKQQKVTSENRDTVHIDPLAAMNDLLQ